MNATAKLQVVGVELANSVVRPLHALGLLLWPALYSRGDEVALPSEQY